MVSKTREKLIEVAKQLFAYKGVENTTMNDIATASDKGRRTIYTYFKNKREIYNAVIEQQSNQIIERLKATVASHDKNAKEKLRDYLLELFQIISQSAPKAEGYRRLLVRDHKRVGRIFKAALDKERHLFEELLRQGVESGEFDPKQAQRLPALISLTISSVYYYTIDDSADASQGNKETYLRQITEFVVSGISASTTDNQQTP